MLTEALDDNDPSQRALGIKAGLEWRRAADCRLFYVDRGWSDGMWKAWDLYQEEGLSTEIRRISRT